MKRIEKYYWFFMITSILLILVATSKILINSILSNMNGISFSLPFLFFGLLSLDLTILYFKKYIIFKDNDSDK